jgi:hypothetical protein
MIPKKMLTKVREVNMSTMTQINTLIVRAGSKELSTPRLKELRSIAKHAAMEITTPRLRNEMPWSRNPLPKLMPLLSVM